MDTETMTTDGDHRPAPEDLLEHPLLTLVGLLIESSQGAEDLLETTLPAESGLTGQLFGPLLRLARSEGGSLRMTDLAAQSRYTPSAVTRVSDRLERMGFVERRACPGDRRVTHLVITDAGRTAVESSMPAHIAMIDDEILAALDPAERDQLEVLLRKVRDAVHPGAAAVTPNDAETNNGESSG